MTRFQLHNQLEEAQKLDSLPSVTAYQRIDGPGSSLDLREFQQALWHLPDMPKDIEGDPARHWSCGLPRTVAITIDTGTRITAYPFNPDLIGVESNDFKDKVIAKPGEVLPIKRNWLLKILDLFNLSGVKFVLENLRPDIKSAGLGGSATVATGVCILANELAGKPFNEIQLISMASRIEQDFGVSIAGTQEQSNVVFGGVRDYIWFPWGIPGDFGSGYGESLRSEIVSPQNYGELESRMAIFHTGRVRLSTDVNSVWIKALSTTRGFKLHKKKPEIAYQFREGLRLRKWDQVVDAIRKYREIRTALCPGYMTASEKILKIAEAKGCTVFPLGAGGGGAVLIFSASSKSLQSTRKELRSTYDEITFKIKAVGHDLFNLANEEGRNI
jgi:galactokinase/mevalonate kinase-like predicted kinase